MTWLWNNIEYVGANFKFLDTAKEIWTIVRDTYSMKKNASEVFEVSEDIFSLRQDDKSLEDYYNHFKDMIDDSTGIIQSQMILNS